MTLLTDLPAELLVQIYKAGTNANEQEQVNRLNSLTKTSRALRRVLKPELRRKAFYALIQAVVDDDRKKVARILDIHPKLLLWEALPKHTVESKHTWQTFYAEGALKMAVKRRQIKMIEVMLPYYDKIKQTEAVMVVKAEALSAWKDYEIQKNAVGEDKIVIPADYADYAQSLIGAIKTETFPNGNLSESTDDMLTLLFNKLLPKNAAKLDDCLDPELFLLALYQVYAREWHTFSNESQDNAFCIRVIGLAQSVLSPETAKIFCEGFGDVVLNKKAISAQGESLKFYDGESFYRASRTGCELELMSALPGNDIKKAVAGKVYLSADGTYVVRDTEGVVRQGRLDASDIDLTIADLPDLLTDEGLKKRVLSGLAGSGISFRGVGFEHFIGMRPELIRCTVKVGWRWGDVSASDACCWEEFVVRKQQFSEALRNSHISATQTSLLRVVSKRAV